MYISFVTICVLVAIVIFCWFRKPAKSIANSVAEVAEVSTDIMHSGLSQLRDQVEVAAITSSVKNTLEVLTIIQDNKEIIEKGVTVHSLYCGLRATQADLLTDAKGKELNERQKIAVYKSQIMSLINTTTQPEAQPKPQPAVQPAKANPNAEVFRI